MSLRPRVAVEEASHFTLRSVFNTAPTVSELSTSTQFSPEVPSYSPTNAAQCAPSAHKPPPEIPMLAMNVSAPAPTSVPTSGLKFNLPLLKPNANSAPATTAMQGSETRSLQPGYITGGFGNDSNEVLRLNALVEELSAKQQQLTEKLALAEQSVVRGNTALSSERAASAARITALTAEVRSAQQREAAARTELATTPRAAQLDLDKFKMQAEGAVQLQARYDELSEQACGMTTTIETLQKEKKELETQQALANDLTHRAVALEELVESMKEEKEALVQQHAALAIQLDNAKLSMDQAAQQVDKEREASTSEKAEVDAQVSELTAKLAARDEKIAAAMEEMKAMHVECCEANKLNETLDERLASLRTERDESLKQAEAQTQAALDRVADLEAKMNEVPSDVQELFSRYNDAKARADEMTAQVQQAGATASTAQLSEMARARMDARTLHRATVTGSKPKENVSFVVEDDGYSDTSASAAEAATESLNARQALATKLNTQKSLYGISGPATMDCCVDFCTMTSQHMANTAAKTPTDAMIQIHDNEETAKQMRIDAMVQAVSEDLKHELKYVSERYCPGASTGVGA